ncbi:hypothetical protein K0U91_02890 [Chryseobacterium chendengshani]|uniref:hypothetical protein n=1 Tax=Chryseobacterium sp. LJ668 TaxID=2864040 RepID=UPI001C689459|nr:hypothetical protein [Chryseobacterium sp. LJ668]MBW8524163.1 hypothetical protein [Chryseobacterium sp. LJ668]QYK17095.1 hypothetical protein K0U91_02890 [Chryseobacterium sp. LJ668]
MKKIFLYILAGSLCFSACKKDDDEVATYVEPENIATQNTYDDQAIQKFLNDNYLDAQGNIKSFSSTDAADDNEVKLINLNPQTLPSGVIYIVRNNAQPTPGTTIAPTDIVRLMMRARTSLAGNTDGETKFLTTEQFVNYSPLDGTGSPIVDPMFYYVTDAKMALYKNTDRNFYEIEGFKEALQKFKAFNKADDENYNLQGVIIVPSRAAFARDSHYNYSGYSFRNRTFIFNFQVYKTTPRT